MTYKIRQSTGGLYAWYYIPSETDADRLVERLTSLCSPSAKSISRLRFDYGLRFEAEGTANAFYSGRNAADTIVQQGVASNPDAIMAAFNTFMAPYFTRPIYIGVSKDLKTRLYEYHYKSLIEFWEPNHPVSRFLEGSSNLARSIRDRVELVQSHLNIEHSFALEARVRGLHPADLEVFYAPTDWLIDESARGDTRRELRRSIERLLQLIAIPTFGRI